MGSLYESDVASVKSEIATFFAVFPGGMVFANTDRNDGYDTVLVGQLTNRKIDMDKITAKLASQGYKKVAASLQDADIDGADGLFSNYSASDADLKSWLADAQINHDYDMRLQYLAGWRSTKTMPPRFSAKLIYTKKRRRIISAAARVCWGGYSPIFMVALWPHLRQTKALVQCFRRSMQNSR